MMSMPQHLLTLLVPNDKKRLPVCEWPHTVLYNHTVSSLTVYVSIAHFNIVSVLLILPFEPRRFRYCMKTRRHARLQGSLHQSDAIARSVLHAWRSAQVCEYHTKIKRCLQLSGEASRVHRVSTKATGQYCSRKHNESTQRQTISKCIEVHMALFELSISQTTVLHTITCYS